MSGCCAARAVAPQLGLQISECEGVEVARQETPSIRKAEVRLSSPILRASVLPYASFLPGVLKGGSGRRKPSFGMLCYMADMSRNAVYNLPTAKRMLRYLALMGYDSLMLYTEDTFELPGYLYFGHMRGRFSQEELKEIDDYAYDLGIEVIPCVQTLAHLATALRWPGFGFQDTGDILLVGDERTYKFIDAILGVCAKCFRSRRINVGMDEAHMLARGAYLDKNGYRPPSEVMLEHLDRVVKLCAENGFTPMIWSDMFFRMAFGGRYRVSEGEIAREIIDKVPSLTLIYWDYYSLDRGLFSHMLDCHKKFQKSVVLPAAPGSGTVLRRTTAFPSSLPVCSLMSAGKKELTILLSPPGGQRRRGLAVLGAPRDDLLRRARLCRGDVPQERRGALP